MEILSPEAFASRFDFVRPMHPEPEPKRGAFSIPFEYGACEKGTRISLAKARQIAAELRAEIAEAEKAELKEAFEAERSRVRAYEGQLSKAHDEAYEAMREAAEWKRRYGALRRKRGK